MIRNRTMTWTLALLVGLSLTALARAAVYTPANAGPAQEEVLAALTQYAGGELPFTTVPDDGTMDVRIAQRLYEEAPSGRAVAVVGAAQLRLAQVWLIRGSIEKGPLGLVLAVIAAEQAKKRLGDAQLGLRICRAFVYPYLHLAPRQRWVYGSSEELVLRSLAAAEATGDRWACIEASQLMLTSTDSRMAQDAARLKLAVDFEAEGMPREALAHLAAIDPDGPVRSTDALRARLEAQVAALR